MATPLATLADYFTHHRNTNEPLGLGPDAQKSIVAYQTSNAPYKAAEIEAVVTALDMEGPALCQRLNGFGATILCSILLHSETCLAQQRGFYLLAASVHKIQSDNELTVSEKAKKKSEMSAALPPLIKDFVGCETPDESRRWASILSLAFLWVLRRETHKRWRYLSNVVMLSKRRVIRHLAGSIMRQLVFYGVSLELFHEVEDDDTLFTRFPNSQYHDSQWIISFEKFVEDMPTKEGCSQGEESSTFACGLLYGDTSYTIDEEAAILVTVGSEFSVIVPPSPKRPAVHIDVPIRNIRAFAADQRQNTQSQTPTYALQIDLTEDGNAAFYVNARPVNEACIFVAFKSESAASDVRSATESRIVTIRECMPFSHSETEAIDVSLSRSSNKCDDQQLSLGNLAPDVNDHEYHKNPAIPVQLANTGPQRESLRQQRPASLVREMMQRATSQLPSMAMAAINVSVNHEDDEYLEEVNDIAEELSDSGLTSSFQWQNGLNCIESAPEFQDIGIEGDQISNRPISSNHNEPDIDEAGKGSFAVQHSKPVVTTPERSREPIQGLHALHNAPITPSSQLSAALPCSGSGHSQSRHGSSKVPVPSVVTPVAHAAPKQDSTKTFIAKSKPAIAEKRQTVPAPKRSKFLSGRRKPAPTPMAKVRVDSVGDQYDDYSLPNSPLTVHTSGKSHTESTNPDAKQEVKGSSSPRKSKAREILKTVPDLPSHGVTTAKAKDTVSNQDNTKISSTRASKEPKKVSGKIGGQGKAPRAKDAKDAEFRGYRRNPSKKLSAISAEAQNIREYNSPAISDSDHDLASKAKYNGKPAVKKTSCANVAQPGSTQFRSKRAAAVKANKRIEHQLDSEEAADEPVEDSPSNARLTETKPKSRDTVTGNTKPKSIQLPKSTLTKRNSPPRLSTSKNTLAVASQTGQPTGTENAALGENLASPNKVDIAKLCEPNIPFQPKRLGTHLNNGFYHSLHNADGDDNAVPVKNVRQKTPQQKGNNASFVPGSFADDAMPWIQDGSETGPSIEYEFGSIKDATVPQAGCSLTRHDNGPRLERDHLVCLETKENTTFEATISKDPFVTKLVAVLPKHSGTIPQLITRKVNPKDHLSAPSGQVLARTQPKNAGASTPLLTDKDKSPAPETSAVHFPISKRRKRKASESDRRPSKRAKALLSDPSLIRTTNRSVRQPLKTPVDRKAAMISFDQSGPKNQGMTSRRYKGEDIGISQAPRGEQLETHVWGKRSPADIQARAPKDSDSPEQTSKPYPPPSNRPSAANVPQGNVIKDKRPSRVSSKARVTADGSPVIVLHNHNPEFALESDFTDAEAVEDALTAAKLDGDRDILMYNDEDYEHMLPSISELSESRTKQASVQFKSCNKKQQPSSPLAASAYAGLDMHHIRDNGTIININTRQPVLSAVPHDPFKVDGSKRDSSFMRALRKSNSSRLAAQGIDKAVQVSIQNPPTNVEDPHKTLVEGPRTKRGVRYEEGRTSSSSSLGSSDAGGTTSDCDQDPHTSTGWRAFEPHQKGMYLVLLEIVKRLVQRQVNREKALQKKVKGYSRGGKMLVERFLDECSDGIKKNKQETARAKADMYNLYSRSMEELSKISRQVLRTRVKDIDYHWSARQQKLLDAAKAALAACEL
ncbi:MAG: hypothetical protein Q9163_001117 [Psora crenata]